jgi:hypothetical protein
MTRECWQKLERAAECTSSVEWAEAWERTYRQQQRHRQRTEWRMYPGMVLPVADTANFQVRGYARLVNRPEPPVERNVPQVPEEPTWWRKLWHIIEGTVMRGDPGRRFWIWWDASMDAAESNSTNSTRRGLTALAALTPLLPFLFAHKILRWLTPWRTERCEATEVYRTRNGEVDTI